MTRVALCSAKGSPGVSTLSCVLGAVWPSDREVVVAECDPSGGDLAGRFSLSTRLGMTSLVLANRQGGASSLDYRAHTQSLSGGLEVLVGPAGADSATALDREIGLLPSHLVSGSCDLIVDCGRLLAGAVGQEKMVREADSVLLLVRPDVASVAHAQWAAGRIGERFDRDVSAIIVGTGVFRPQEVAAELGVAVFGTVALDQRAARMACGVSGSSKAFIRSALVTSAREIVRALIDTAMARDEGDNNGNASRLTRGRGHESHHGVGDWWSRNSTTALFAQKHVNERPRNAFP